MGATPLAGCSHATISADEVGIVRSVDGNIEMLEGPCQVPKWLRTVEKVKPRTASEDQYMRVKFKNGLTEFKPGPISMVEDPRVHISIEIDAVTKLGKGQVMLVYRETEDGRIERSLLEGPCTYMPRSAMEWTVMVPIVVAAEGQYLSMQHLDGHVEYARGPVSMCQDPEKYTEIKVMSAVQLRGEEILVVYRSSTETPDSGPPASRPEAVQRHIIRGPRVYMPESAAEWVHDFSWTGSAEAGRDVNGPSKKKCDALKFTKLRVCPGKMYNDVESVRTKDNALITVKLMLFFRYENIEQMLDNTNDPFGDIINAVTADVIEWCAPKKFDEFLMATEALNTLAVYPQLQAAISKIGMAIDKVVFRGYDAPRALQAMHDSAIEKRTAMSLAREAEEEEQKLSDFKVQKQQERCAKQYQLELEALNHELALKEKSHEVELQRSKNERALELDKLRELKQIDPNMDIGKYLTAKEAQPQVVQCGTLMSVPGSSLGDLETRSNTTIGK